MAIRKVFVTSSGTPVKVFDDATGKLLLSFGHVGGPVQGGNFSSIPNGIAANSSYIYVTDPGGYVQVFNHSGVFQFWFGLGGPSSNPLVVPGSPLDDPIGLAIDSTRLYLIEGNPERAHIFDLTGNHILTFYAGYGQLNTLSVTPGNGGAGYNINDTFLVMQSGYGGYFDYWNHGKVTGIGGGGAVTSAIFYLPPFWNPRFVYKKSVNNPTLTVSGGGSGCLINIDDCLFPGARSIAADGSFIYVTAGDSVSGRVQKFSLAGVYQGSIYNTTGSLGDVTVHSGGTGYLAGDILNVTGGSGTGQVVVLATGGGGSVRFVGLNGNANSGYSIGTNIPTTYGGGGLGCTVDINACSLSWPQGVTSDSTYAYVTESIGLNFQIHVFDKASSSDISVIGPNHGSHKSEFDDPRSLYAYASNIYVPGQGTSQTGCQKLSLPSGGFIRRFKWPTQEFDTPYSFCFTQVGTMLIADYGYDRVYETDLNGGVISLWPLVNNIEGGGPPTYSSGYVNSPSGIFQTATRTYILDSGNNRVVVYDNSGVFQFTFGTPGTGNGQFGYPFGIAVDSTRIYVADSGNDRVQVFDLTGAFQFKFNGSLGAGVFSFPGGVAVDASHIYVTDSYNSRVQVFNLAGVYQFSFGTPGTGDGQFSTAWKVDVSEGHVFVSDPDLSRIQMFNPSGVFILKQTVVASGTYGYGDVKHHPPSNRVYYI